MDGSNLEKALATERDIKKLDEISFTQKNN